MLGLLSAGFACIVGHGFVMVPIVVESVEKFTTIPLVVESTQKFATVPLVVESA